MGVFNSYYISENFKCPCCGLEYDKQQDFQTKPGWMCCWSLGDIIDPSCRYIDFWGCCMGQFNRSDYDKPKDKNGEYPIIKANCKQGEFNCRVYLDEKGKAYREVITMYDKENEKEILIYSKTVKD